jgi:PAS domain S-box-containing protein
MLLCDTTPILIVDDDPHARATLSEILEEEGYNVEAVDLGADAIEHVRLQRYEAALLDIRLPDLDGLRVLQHLLRLDPTLPVILLSGYATVENTIAALNQGAFAYVTKPYNLDEIKATLRRAIEMKALALKAERAETALRESEERFRSVVESATDAIILADAKGDILSWNNGAQRLFRYHQDEVLGRPLTLLMPARYRTAHQQGLERAKHTGQRCLIGKTIELHGLRKDGSEFPLELSLATWQTKTGTFYSGIIRDITERKQAEEALRRAYEETEKILSSLPSAILIINDAQEIIYANSLACQHFGSPSGRLVGHCLSEVLGIAADDWHRLAADLCPTASPMPHPLHHGEFQSLKRIYQYRVFPVALYGSDSSQTGLVIWDITEQKHLQEQLIQAEKLASLGTLVSGMAHEINNPMHGILAMAEIILEETEPEKIKEYARDIVSYSKHVADVVRDFACYARPASRDQKIKVDLNERLLEAVKMVRRSPQFGNVQVIQDFEAVPAIWARRSEIDQVFVNLISNATQSMEGRGMLTLSTRLEPEGILAVVADTGAGIPQEYLHRIFDPFFTTKDPGKGTGLGLSIVYKIVTKYGGTISIETLAGEGSKFMVRFPLRRSTSTEAHDGSAKG